MPGNTPTGLLPTGPPQGTSPATGGGAPDAPGTEVSTAPGTGGSGPAGHHGRNAAPQLSVVPAGPGESSLGGTRGAAPGERGKPAARRRNRTWFRVPIPGHVDFKNFSDSSFNDTVGGAS